MAEFVANSWTQLLTAWPYGERWLFAVGASVAHNSTWLTANIFLTIMDRYPYFQRWKVQKGRYPPNRLWMDCTKEMIGGQLMLPFLFWLVYPIFQLGGMTTALPLPSPGTVAVQFLLSFLLMDMLFYWVHRMFHAVPFLYKKVHSMHHRFITPVGIAASYAHPVEQLLANLIPTLIGPVITGMHMLPFFLWFALRMWETVDAHSGYDLPWSPWAHIPGLLGVNGHDWHHSHNRGNFGISKFWDWAFGTDKEYKDWQKNPEAHKGILADKKGPVSADEVDSPVVGKTKSQ